MFGQYIDRIFSDLFNLKSGYSYIIDQCWNHIEVEIRIKLCCLFISESKEIYQFNEAFTVLTRK